MSAAASLTCRTRHASDVGRAAARLGPPVAVQRIAVTAERALPWLVTAAALVGLAAPRPGRFVADYGGVQVVLILLVFSSGLSVAPGAMAASRRAAPRVALTIGAGLIALPALAWFVSRGVPPGPLRQGVLALGIAPTEIAAVALTGMAAGNPAVAAAILVVTALATVALAGPILSLLSSATIAPPVTVLVTLVGIVALPLAAGAGLRRTTVGDSLSPLADPLAVATVTVLVWLVASQAELNAALMPAAGAVLAFLAVSVALGEAVAYRAPADTAHALRLSLAMRDFAVTAGAATTAFGPAAAAPAGLYGIAVLAYGALYVKIRTPAPASHP